MTVLPKTPTPRTSTFAHRALHFYHNLRLPLKLPENVNVMNPYLSFDVQSAVEKFFTTYFSDTHDRVYVFGINPGRFGAGLTGVTFTDPVALERFCGIPNSFDKKRETSSDFVYRCIEELGGPTTFYKHFFLTAISPLGFIRDDKNYNYYDDDDLLIALRPFILDTLYAQLTFGARRDIAIVLGTGKNYHFFNTLNKEYDFFSHIYALEHPRFIMQYRRKRISEYLKKYHTIFSRALSL